MDLTERKYLHEFESIALDDPALGQALLTLSAPSNGSFRLRTILLSQLISGIRSEIAGLLNLLQQLEGEIEQKQSVGNYALQQTLVDVVAALQSAIERRQPEGNYALQTDLANYQPKGNYALEQALADAISALQAVIAGKQPSGDYAPLSIAQDFTAHTQTRGNKGHIPDSGITNVEIAAEAAISWNKIAVPSEYCKIYPNANVPIATSGNWSALNFNTIAFDSNQLFSASDGGIKIKVGGLYLLEAACRVIEVTASATPPGPYFFKLGIKAGSVTKVSGFAYSTIPTIGIDLSGTRIEKLNAGDIIQLFIWQNSGKSVCATNGGTLPIASWLGAYLIR